MGLSSLRKLVDPQPLRLGQLQGQTVAVDANNMLWTFTAGMAAGGAAPTDDQGRPVSHLIGLVNRLTLYAEHGVDSIWVFDGKQPALKEQTLTERVEQREAAIDRGSLHEHAVLTGEQLREARTLLGHLGVPALVAPSEADAQCAHFVRGGQADAAITQDYDILLHGCPLTYRNVTATGRRRPERIELAPALAKHELTRQQLVHAAVLIGTDYNDGIRGVGPVTALKLVRKHPDLQACLAAREVEMPEAEDVARLFLEHPVDEDASVEKGWPDASSARKLLTERGLGGSRFERLVNALSRLS